MRRPDPALLLERPVVGRMPVRRGRAELEARIRGQLVQATGDLVAASDAERAAGREVVLEVDDEERLRHGFDNRRAMPSPDRLRALLLTPEEASEMDNVGGQNDAAVLVPLYIPDGDLHVVFTRRRDALRRHAGEISFPGGRPDFEGEDLRTTALREAEEEIGLPRDDVEIVGALPPTGTFVTNYRIHPYVGVIEPGREWQIQPNEVEIVLEFALPELVRGFEMQRLLKKGVPIKMPTYTVDGNLVGGARARCVQPLRGRLEPIL